MNEIKQSTKPNNVLNQVNLIGRPAIYLQLAIGKQNALKLRELEKKVSEIQEEEGKIDAMCEIIAEFSNFKSGEQARESLTEMEIMDLYFAIRGDIESSKRLFTLTSQSK